MCVYIESVFDYDECIHNLKMLTLIIFKSTFYRIKYIHTVYIVIINRMLKLQVMFMHISLCLSYFTIVAKKCSKECSTFPPRPHPSANTPQVSVKGRFLASGSSLLGPAVNPLPPRPAVCPTCLCLTGLMSSHPTYCENPPGVLSPV